MKLCPVCTYDNDPSKIQCELCTASLIPKNGVINALNMLKIGMKQQKITENYEQAYNIIPESMITVDLLYIPMLINDQSLIALVDTGAQVSIMSEQCAIRCGLQDIIDERVKHEVRGVGSQQTVGRIWMVDVIIGTHTIPCSFTILKNVDFDALFGLNLLMAHNCTINFMKKCLTIGNYDVEFVKKNRNN